ncbi:MAG: hypothetical protein AAB593_00865, partial [Patescibacteria group bacterium]
NFVIPKKYNLESVIQMGVTENNIPLINPEETIALIKQRGSLNIILANLKEKDKLELWKDYNYISSNSFSIENQSIFLIISAKNGNPQKSKELIEEISNFIIERDNKVYEKSISSIEEKKATIKEKLSLAQQQLNENSVLLSYLNNGIISLSPNNQPNALVLQGYLASRDNIKERVDMYKQQINDLKFTINDIDNQKETYKPTKIITEPVIPDSPSLPSLKINLVIALILGLFISILLSFIIEWWKENKKRL